MSRSTMKAPIAEPVGHAISAFGHFAHHARICAVSIVASLKPFLTSGCLVIGWHGKTGHPRAA